MVLCWWTTYTIEKQKRRELLLLLSVSNDRQRRNDLVNSMLPKSVAARLRSQQPSHRRTSTAGMALQRHVSENFESVSVAFHSLSEPLNLLLIRFVLELNLDCIDGQIGVIYVCEYV
jgi:hypothetical protein